MYACCRGEGGSYWVLVSLGLVFVAVAGLATVRLREQKGGGDPSVVLLYCLILCTGLLRAAWLLAPKVWLEQSCSPLVVYAFEGHWIQQLLSEMLMTLGSVSIFSIFILFMMFWNDLVKKIFEENVIRSSPIKSFWRNVACIVAAQVLIIILYLSGVYSSQGMTMVNSFFLIMLALGCSIEISRLSHRFRTLLQTLGEVNNLSIERQRKRIVWITVSSNCFFAMRVFSEMFVFITLFVYWKRNKSFSLVFATPQWDMYLIATFGTEAILLVVILYVLRTEFGSQTTVQEEDDYLVEDSNGETALLGNNGVQGKENGNYLSINEKETRR